MKKILCFILLFLFHYSLVDADIVHLRNGAEIDVGNTWRDGGQVECELYGRIVGYS